MFIIFRLRSSNIILIFFGNSEMSKMYSANVEIIPLPKVEFKNKFHCNNYCYDDGDY